MQTYAHMRAGRATARHCSSNCIVMTPPARNGEVTGACKVYRMLFGTILCWLHP